MGRDKALLPYRGATLLEHAAYIVGEVTPDVRILSGPRRRYEGFGLRVIEDPICGAGPLAGLYAALASATADDIDRIIWLAVDLPLVPPSLLQRLAGALDDADVAMARTEHGVEPLCAAFRTTPAIENVRRALLTARLKLTTAIEGLRTETIDAEARDFANLNSPADYAGLTFSGDIFRPPS
jgi:molybdopterin-guanine dinucleotide biosynthesis protein A